MKPTGFTLIETMLAVLLMALLASSVALSFSKPLQAARAQDCLDLVHSFDASTRQAAISSGKNVRLVIDLSADKWVQKDGADLQNVRREAWLPTGNKIDAVQVDGHLVSTGQAIIDVSSHGWSRSYAIHLKNSNADCWLVFAGLSGANVSDAE